MADLDEGELEVINNAADVLRQATAGFRSPGRLHHGGGWLERVARLSTTCDKAAEELELMSTECQQNQPIR